MFNELARARADEIDRELHEVTLVTRADPNRPDPHARRRRRRRWATRLSGIVPAPSPSEESASAVTIRAAIPGDARRLALLAQADDRHVPAGDVLVAEIDTEIVAALPLDGRPAVTHAWRATGDVVELLELRSEQIKLGRRRRAAA
jgi:hypothetical protein